MDVQITPANKLGGTLTIPADKSISHRALLIGPLANGTTEIEGISDAADPKSTFDCIRRLGIDAERKEKRLLIKGRGIRGFRKPLSSLNCGNSGTTMRLLSGILAGQEFTSELVGDESLSRRPMERIIEPLTRMGAKITSSSRFTSPLRIEGVGRLVSIEYELPLASAQVKSAILLAGLFAEGTTRVIENKPTRDHTERMLGLRSYPRNGAKVTEITGGYHIEPQKFAVPGDISSAAYFIAAALLVPNSDLILQNVGLNPTRTRFLELWRAAGAQISVESRRTVGGEPLGNLRVKTSALITQIDLSGDMIPSVIDEIPILAVTAAVAGVPFKLTDATELRNKESDRIQSTVSNLREMGVEVEEYHDGFEFGAANNLHDAVVDSYKDHRIAMAFAVAGLKIPGMVIRDSECVEISFPGFWQQLQQVSKS